MGYGSGTSSSSPGGYGVGGYGQAAFNNNSTITVQSVANFARTIPDISSVVMNSAGGLTQEPARTIANDVMQKFLAQNMNWKFNRGLIPPFLTVALQQDYVTNINNLGWLEQAWRVDINNSTNNGNLAPKPIFVMEACRDLAQTAYQSYPFMLSWVPNSIAVMGQWFANTAYPCGYGVAMTPQSPIQQFIDKNGNILFLDSSVLGLNLNSPGFTGTPIPLPTPNPYGISGNTQPFAAPNATPGTQVTDGSVTWTVADPNAYAMRTAPIPAFSGLVWLLQPIYQVKPPVISNLQQTISPIPDEFGYLFRSGFVAMCYLYAGAKQGAEMVQQWEEQLWTALRSADRERDEASFYPTQGVSGGSPWGQILPVGPAWPFQLFPY